MAAAAMLFEEFPQVCQLASMLQSTATCTVLDSVNQQQGLQESPISQPESQLFSPEQQTMGRAENSNRSLHVQIQRVTITYRPARV